MVTRPCSGDSRHASTPSTSHGHTTTDKFPQVSSGYQAIPPSQRLFPKSHSVPSDIQLLWIIKSNGRSIVNGTREKAIPFQSKVCRLLYQSLLQGYAKWYFFHIRDSICPMTNSSETSSKHVHNPKRPVSRTPSWNVDVVLKDLPRPPLEPLHERFNQKIPFLVTLATAKCRRNSGSFQYYCQA